MLLNWFVKRSLTAKYMIVAVIALFLAFSLLGGIIITFFYEFEPLPKFLLGLGSASLVTIVRLVLMDKSVNKSARMEEDKAKNHAQLHFFVRYFLTLAYAVVVVILSKYVGVIGAIIGLFNMQLSAYIANYFINVKNPKIYADKNRTASKISWNGKVTIQPSQDEVGKDEISNTSDELDEIYDIEDDEK